MATTQPVEPKPKSRRWLGRVGRGARVLLLSYLGIILVMLFFENRFVFVPSSPADFWRDPPVPGWDQFYLTSGDGTQIHAWWCPHAGATTTILYCHGNGGNLSHRGGAIQKLQEELNASVLIFDYPGYGKSGGNCSEAGCYESADVCYNWLTKEKKIPGESILLYGNSLGGGVATHLAVKYPHRALILCKTFSSLPDVGSHRFPWLPVRWMMRNRFDSLARIKDCKRPVFITHGKLDDTIPYDQGVALYEAANEPKFFLPDDDGDHDSGLDRVFFTELKRFLAQHAPVVGS